MYFFFPVGHRNRKFKTTLLGEVTELTLRLKLLRQTLPQSWFLREGERVGCRGWGGGGGMEPDQGREDKVQKVGRSLSRSPLPIPSTTAATTH